MGLRIALPATIDPAAVAGIDPTATVTGFAGDTMGTTWSVRAVLPRGIDAGGVHAAIVARLDGIVAEMSHWSATSLLSGFNRSAAGSWTILPSDFAQVIAAGLRIADITDGAFDPTIGRVVELWGFGAVPAFGVPDVVALATAQAAAGWDKLAFEADPTRIRQPGGMALDLSGIAKGYAVDAVADLLAAQGIRDCLVEIGGELVGRGIRPDGDPWWVDLESPPGVDIAPVRIALHGLAVATSGDYRRGAHTLDPRTGRAIGNGVVAVSVVAATAMAADAWATALTVLGPDAGIALADRQGIAARIVVDRGGRVDEFMSKALAAMFVD